MATTLGVIRLKVCRNSLLMVSQVNGEYAAKDEQMVAYLQLVLSLKSKFSQCEFKQVPRSKNNYTDFLANLASTVEYQFWREIPVVHCEAQHPVIGRYSTWIPSWDEEIPSSPT